jgi:hypothetical protein
MHLIHRCLPNLGLPNGPAGRQAGLSAHTAQALATRPVSAPIPKAKAPFLEFEKSKNGNALTAQKSPGKAQKNTEKAPIFADFRNRQITCTKLYESVRNCTKLCEVVRIAKKLYELYEIVRTVRFVQKMATLYRP